METPRVRSTTTTGKAVPYFRAVQEQVRSNSPESTVERAGSDPEERYARYHQLVRRAAEVFGDEAKASLWLSTPSPYFNGVVPLAMADGDDFDPNRFETVFLQIEHGIYT